MSYNCHPFVALKAVALFVVLIVTILMDHLSLCWIILPTSSSMARRGNAVLLGNPKNSDQPEQEGHVHLGLDPQNPCWQDIADEDCALSTAYSASFIAKDWIQSMPCAEGIAVSASEYLLFSFSHNIISIGLSMRSCLLYYIGSSLTFPLFLISSSLGL